MKAMDPQEMARALGIPLFHTPFFLPRYPDGECGKWRVSHTGVGIDHGYYTRQWLVSGMPVLLRRNLQNPDAWETWMSLTPHEIESQEPGCMFARGHTVVMGLGMGWIALNAALNPAVEEVTVVEWDADVIDLFHASGVLAQVSPPVQAKICIVQDDARRWQPPASVDFLFADIWRTLAEPGTLDDVRAMQRHVQAGEVYFWGQELTLYAAFRRLYGDGAPLATEGLGQCLEEEIRLPLLLPKSIDYARRIETVVKNRRDRRLPLEESPSERGSGT
ncbi:MAG: hypothetical protein PHN75_16150 [Syntrophales bacterium]|nr:hypothetical protein [Syntrophales bacterium]